MSEGAFTLLGLEGRLTLSEEEIGEAFRKRAGAEHPDAGGDEAEFGRLREARDLLLSPSRRLAEWLGGRGVEIEARGEIDAGLVELFQEVASAGAAAEEAIRVGGRSQSSLGKAMGELRLMKEREAVKGLLEKVAGEIGRRVAVFPEMEELGERVDPVAAAKLGRDLRFLEKWRAGLRGVYGRMM